MCKRDFTCFLSLCNYLMGPYNAGPKSALYLRVAKIRAGVKRAGVKRAVFLVKELKKAVLILKSLFRENDMKYHT